MKTAQREGWEEHGSFFMGGRGRAPETWLCATLYFFTERPHSCPNLLRRLHSLPVAHPSHAPQVSLLSSLRWTPSSSPHARPTSAPAAPPSSPLERSRPQRQLRSSTSPLTRSSATSWALLLLPRPSPLSSSASPLSSASTMAFSRRLVSATQSPLCGWRRS